MKLSEQAIKTSTPGILQVRRYRDGSGSVADMIYSELQGVSDEAVLVDPLDPTKRRRMTGDETTEDLLVPVVRGGEVVYEQPQLDAIRGHAQQQLASFHTGILRHDNPHRYPRVRCAWPQGDLRRQQPADP